MTSITRKYETVECPEWGETIQLVGHYVYHEKHSDKAKFQFATCPIRENLRLPRSKRNPEYELFTFCKNEDCPLLRNFPEFIKH